MAETGLQLSVALRRPGLELELALEVAPGECLALIGPNGSGKSSCLELVAGLQRPRGGRIACSGEAWFDAERGLDLPPERRRVGLVFQDYALFPHLSVRDNVAYGPRARGLPREEAARRAESWLARLGLGGASGRAVDRLSGGERQRVALARTLAAEPRALLLDEPLASLDVATRAAVRGELRGFLAECGLPTLFVSHDPLDALVFGQRIAVLEAGRLTQVGGWDDLVRHPRSPFVAELAGLNLFRAQLAPGSGLKEARLPGLVFHVLADELQGEAYLVFAPSEVALAASHPAGSPQNVFAATVRDVLPLRDRLRVVLDAGAPLVAEVTREAAAALALGPGRAVWASVKATAIRVYR